MSDFFNLKFLFVFIFAATFFVALGEVSAQSEKKLRKIQAERLKNEEIETKRNLLHKLRTDEKAKSSEMASGSLQDTTEIVRATAPFSILSLPNDEAATKLLPQLQDKSEFVRRETVYALGETQSLLAVEPLLLLLRTEKLQSLQAACAVALGKIGDVSALESVTAVLQKKVGEKDEFTRRSAARAIGQIALNIQYKRFLLKNPNADLSKTRLEYESLSADNPEFQKSLQILLRVLQNSKESDDVKRETAFALGEIGDASAIPVLQANINAKDYYLAEIVKNSIKKINRQ